MIVASAILPDQYTTMYFYLSKTLGDLAVPSHFLALLLVCGLLLWRTRFAAVGRWLTIVGVLLALLPGFVPLATLVTLPLENRFPQWDSSRGPPDGIIVLGGVFETHISLRRKQLTLGGGANRIVAALELFHRYPQIRILFAGGNSNLIFKGAAESALAERFLEQLGVPREQILLDDTSRNTAENAVNALRIAAPKPGERWLLVTSAMHMPRAMGLFRAAGFPVDAYPVDWRTNGSWDVWTIPVLTIGGFDRLDAPVHEWEGLIVDRLTGRTKTLFPAPADVAVK